MFTFAHLKSIVISISTLSIIAVHAEDFTTPGILQSREHRKQGKEFNILPVNWKASVQDKARAEKAWQSIRDWQKDGPVDKRKLHVVYVTITDRPALPDYKGRMDRILKNIQAYYADQMEENGFPPLTFGLDLDKDGKVVVHEAHVDKRLEELNTNTSGPPTREAAEKVLRATGVDPEKDYVLIVAQIPDKKGPYYGSGNAVSGRCWICDAAHLDPMNFASKEEGNYLFTTLGNDNTVYIGGTAHELGHCFSLPHTKELTPATETGISLMGSGNYSYGKEFRNEGKGTFLIPSDAMRLASTPLFSGIDKPVTGNTQADMTDLKLTPVKDGLRLSGKVTGNPPVYALIAYFNPAGGDDYDQSSSIAIPESDGSFTIEAVRPGFKGTFELNLLALHANGATSMLKGETLKMNNQGIDDTPLLLSDAVKEVMSYWQNNQKEKAQAALTKVLEKHGNDPKLKKGLAVWKIAVDPKKNEPQGNIPALVADDLKSLDLTTSKPTKVVSGWNKPHWGTLPTNPRSPIPSFSNYEAKTFMYTHAPGEFTYDLGGKWKNFTAQVGLPTGVNYAHMIISVKADGKEVFKSNDLSEGNTVPISINVEGVKTLTIEANPAPNHGNGGCWAIVADPVLTR